jgi:hypothetical protein
LVEEFDTIRNTFNQKANLPISVNRHCGASDPLSKSLWILGGYESCSITTDRVFRYNISQNSWSLHSLLPWPTGELACGIIRKPTGEQWLLTVGGQIRQGSIAYLDITNYNSTTWRIIGSLYDGKYQIRMSMISPTPFAAYLLGGNSERYGISLRNFWEYNMNTNAFEDGSYFLQREMHASTWAMTRKSYKALQNCFSYVTYAAVGWGGDHYKGVWDVLLRSRQMAGDPRLPVKCDNAIPDLLPGKFAPGVTALGYRLIVCGGRNGQEVSACFWLDTNSKNPEWNSMAPMLIPRAEFPLITYGDAIFAIGGWKPGATNQVDRWTITKGWVNMANYPLVNIHRQCAVADDGYDAIYVLGGLVCHPGCYIYDRVYKYTVSTDTWSNFPNLPTYRHDSGCGIIHKRTDGHRWMIHVGGAWTNSIFYYDLTTSSGWVNYGTIEIHWERPFWISLTPYESFLTAGHSEWGHNERHRWVRHQILLLPISNIRHRYCLVRYRIKICWTEGLQSDIGSI